MKKPIIQDLTPGTHTNIDTDKVNNQIAGTIMKLNNEYIRPRDMLMKIIDHL